MSATSVNLHPGCWYRFGDTRMCFLEIMKAIKHPTMRIYIPEHNRVWSISVSECEHIQNSSRITLSEYLWLLVQKTW